MKTTAIFVEQVFVGLIVLAIGALPFINWNLLDSTLINLGKGIGIVAIAYLLGIIFDRFTDTILSRCDQYHRLKFCCQTEQK
ncbi:hypothetical protein IID10_05285 [candidate division KSB1 bacterium]|nr:hypothetical protein [candidate division KSB1 bacterium]TDI91830.1 MAG: hypothetical protein E2O77_05900 [Caldithrix sp.]